MTFITTGLSFLSARASRICTRQFVVLAIVVTVFAGAFPAGASRARVHPRASSQTYAVGVARCTFVDRTRSVPNYSTSPPSILSTVRTLVTEIRYPIPFVPGGAGQVNGATPAPQAGGYPMIVFAHGYDVTPDTYAPLLNAWVRAGFVVAAPFFPDENANAVAAQHGADTEGDLSNEPADLAFVIHSLLQSSSNQLTECHVVSGLVNPSDIGLAGHSDGADAVGLLSYALGKDPNGVSFSSLRAGIHIRATVVLSGAEDSRQRYASVPGDSTLLVIQSAADQCNPIHDAVKLFNDLHQPNKWFLELLSAHHLPPFDGVDVPAFRVASADSTRFFRMFLQGLAPTTGLLIYGNENPGLAVMYQGANGPPRDGYPKVAEHCGPN